MEQTAKHQNPDLEYEQINNNFRFLADVRFKLLALVPTLGGVAVFVLAQLGLEAGKASPSSSPEFLVVLLLSLFGFFASLGITMYDQRNSELYNALIHRAKYLEKEFGVPSTPGGLRVSGTGGQFNERPKRGRRLIFEVGHDLGLALIYGPVLGAWFFPALYAGFRLVGTDHAGAQTAAGVAAVLAVATFIHHLVFLDDREMQLYDDAAKRDGIENRNGPGSSPLGQTGG